MSAAPHRIRRQSWRVTAGSAAEAFALRRQLREEWESALLPALERAFDAAGAGEAVVRIPRLEIRVRVGSLDELAERLPALISEQLGEHLRTIAGHAAGPSGPGVGAAAAGADRIETLLHYLRTGSLPWHEAGGPAGEVAERLRSTARAEVGPVVEALAGEPDPAAFCFRLLQLVAEEEATALRDALAARIAAPWRGVLLRLLSPPRGGGASGPGVYARHRVAASLVARALHPGTSAAVTAARLEEAVETAAGALPPGERDAVLALAAAPSAGLARPDAESGRSPDRTADRIRDDLEEAGEAPDFRAPGDPPIEAADAVDAAPADLRARAGRGPPSENDEPATAVPFAGLILLHPFVAPLLRNTGIAEAERIPEHSLPRAAALLHFAATGRAEIHEFELGLIRVLLGVGAEAPLPVAEGLLRPADAEEVESLLQAVVGYWSVLKGTSVEGLRGSFLRRGGLLRHEDLGWRLRPEPAPFDVLLDHLPWSLSIVKLPWMPEPIYTEWTAR